MRSRLKFSGPARAAAVAAVTSALVATAGLGTAAPAQSAPSNACPAPYPVADLVPGAPVTGLTVTQGTTPQGFGGKVVGVLENGIGPGLDMILVDVSVPGIDMDKVGVWAGMSGSPVYAANGQLIGAISYGLSLGPSTIAGVTPAAGMYKLLHSAPQAAPALRSKVKLPQSLRAKVVRSGAATSAQAEQGLSRLRIPFTVSGVGADRLAQMAPVLHFGRSQLTAAAGTPTSATPIDIVAGGNLGASLSYGTVSAGGLGTATAVCGDEILAFGHSMLQSGPSTLSLHGASATHIQDDQTLGGFKSGNFGAPIGTVDGDRLAGLHAVKGALPPAARFSALSTAGGSSFTATSHLTVPDFVPDLGFVNLATSQDKVIDRVGKGTAWATWTIKGTRKSGAPFSFTRKDLYADPYDISAASAFTLAEDLYTIQENPGEVVKITSVTSESHLYQGYQTYVVQKVQARMFGRWIPLQKNQPSPLRAGKVAKLKVFLTSREGAPRTLNVRVYVPTHAAKRVGILDVTGGNEGSQGSDGFFAEGQDAFSDATQAPTSKVFPQVLKELAAAPQHNEVVATVHFRNAPRAASKPRTGSTTMNHVVGGSLQLPVVALP